MNYYIHVPFCASKCGYCAFYSEAGVSSGRIGEFLTHLEKQLAAVPDDAAAETIYIGGGTPTLLSAAQLERLLEQLFACLNPVPDCEVSIEANPETLDREKIALLRKYVSRLSLGVQSFDEVSRCRIGRRCSQEKLMQAMELVSAAGFPHWNCDLIYSLPGQTAGMWENDLITAGCSGADHISCYALTPEENSRLGGEFEADDERESRFYMMAEEILASFGIKRYEISNYASPGGRCRHNLNVWRGGRLCGFGPAAAGFDGTDRMIEPESLDKWLTGAPPEWDKIPHDVRLNEIFAVNLRTVDGWTPELWAAVPGADGWSARRKIAAKLEKIFPEYLHNQQGCIKLTGNGLLFWNMIAQELF